MTQRGKRARDRRHERVVSWILWAGGLLLLVGVWLTSMIEMMNR